MVYEVVCVGYEDVGGMFCLFSYILYCFVLVFFLYGKGNKWELGK